MRRSVLNALLFLSLLAAAPAPAVAAGAESDRAPAVTGAVQATRNPATVRAHSSPQLALNPRNGELVIVESDVRGDLRCTVHISVDGGDSWFVGGDPMVSPYSECSQKAINGPYATLTFDREGILYVAFMASSPEFANAARLPIHIFLARSEDGGRTFQTSFVHKAPEPVIEDEGLHNNDRPMIAVDQQDPSKVYVAWMQRGAGQDKSKALVAASEDSGTTFAPPVDLSDERGGYQPRLAVDPDGTLHAIYPIGTSGIPPGADQFQVVRHVYHRASNDQGQTWSQPVEVEQGNAGFYGGRKWLLAADQNSGALYAVWYGHPEPTFDARTQDLDIFLRASTDGGQTWSERRIVNDDADGALVNHYDPGISIAPNGRIDIAWYDFRNSPYPERFPATFAAPFNNGGYQDVYYTWSDDGGRTFHPNVRITDRIINREIGVWSNNIHSHMSLGIASTNDAVYFAWQDTRNGNYQNDSEDVYMASARHGEPIRPTSTLIWALVTVGVSSLVLGMGLALVLAWWATRRLDPRERPRSGS